jgi:hypothetical protein
MSSFSSFSPPDLEASSVLLDLAADDLHQPLLEAGLMRSALRRRDDVHERARDVLVACPPAQRDVDLALRSTSVGTIAPPAAARDGLGEVPDPVRRQVSVIASGARKSANSEMPPS